MTDTTELATEDFRLADFKLLFPLGPTQTVMSEYAACWWFVSHLAKDVGKIIVLCNSAEQVSAVSALADNIEGQLVAPEPNLIDVLVTMTDQHYDNVRAGGVVVRVWSGAAVNAPPSHKFERLGSWYAAPSWPEFRYLFPVTSTGGRAAREEFRQPLDTNSTVLRVYRRKGEAAQLTFQEQVAASLRHAVDANISAPTKWTLFSGQRGEGNPIVLG